MKGLGLKKLFKNIAGTLGRQVISGVVQLTTLAIIARVFGPSGNGVYTLALLLPAMLATFLNLGVSPANVYFLGANKVAPKQAWKVTLKISGRLSAIGLSIGGLIIYFKSSSFFPAVPIEILWLSLLFFPLTLITANISGFFQGLQEFKQFNVVLLLQPLLNLIGVGTLLIVGYSDICYILICYFVSLIITQYISFSLLQNLLDTRTGPNVNGYGKKLLNYGYKAHFSNILAFINYRADIFILGYFIGAAPVGIYAVAVTITEKLWLLSNAISTVLLPRLSELSSEEDKRRVLTPLIARWVLWLTLFASLVLLLIGDIVIQLIFGDEFKEAYLAIVYLVPGIVVGACSRVLANDIAARGRPELNLSTSWITVIINIIANILLIPQYGLQGAALATSFAYIVNFLMRLTIHNYFTKVAFYKNIIIGIDDFNLIKSVMNKNK